MYKVVFTRQAQKDAKGLSKSHVCKNAETILEILKEDPFKAYPPYIRLLGDLSGAFSRRINIQHRIVYQVYQKEKIVKVIRMWTRYE
ncbi:MAG: Txe/YoeB family addiction module toxin [Sediminispirochaetaceae bacterium]